MDELRPDHVDDDAVEEDAPDTPIDAAVIDRLAAYGHEPERSPSPSRPTSPSRSPSPRPASSPRVFSHPRSTPSSARGQTQPV